MPFVHVLDPNSNVFAEPGATYVPGVEETIPGNPSSQTVTPTSEDALLAKHTVCVSQECLVDLDIDSDNNNGNGNGPRDRSAKEDAIEAGASGKSSGSTMTAAPPTTPKNP